MKVHSYTNYLKIALAGLAVTLAIALSARYYLSLNAGAQVNSPVVSQAVSSNDSGVAGTAPVSVEPKTNDGSYITVNVEVTDEGYKPSLLSLPAGRQVMLVMRNRGRVEHHFHITGLVPSNMMWLSKEPDVNPSLSMSLDEHAQHQHGGDLVPYHICTSGVCPTENTVHLHAVQGDMDMVLFTPTSRGTFEIVCPLHDNLKATVTVF